MVRTGRQQALIRPLVAGDADTIALHRYPNESDAAERPIYSAWVTGAIERGIYLGFLAETQGQVVAGAGLTILEWGPSRGDSHPERARIANVWTHPDFRRQGLARKLVLQCIATAKERGASWLSLSSSKMARPLYAELGFTPSTTEMRLNLQHSLGFTKSL